MVLERDVLFCSLVQSSCVLGLERQVSGLSMGGVYAAMAESLHPTPFSTLPFLSPYSFPTLCSCCIL
ncbi:hypothetical protein FRX31_029781 [Thalictrum thalictroides]|uniref:Uncharacterized protein n=1 Tax=Thalictrum thalictroides TaxID=46969 RepID=A0A7J6V8C7_THATH|nr:hypothetical protein FRX31_029781 [Thalictrum thalictroides]